MTFTVEENTTPYHRVNREHYTRIYTMNNCIRETGGGYDWENASEMGLI